MENLFPMFSLLQPVYFTILLLIIAVLLLILTQRKQWLNPIAVIFVSLSCVVIATVLLIINDVIIEQYNIKQSPFALYAFVFALIIASINIATPNGLSYKKHMTHQKEKR
ncbi:hypothetical protein GCM10007425_01010 [Lysinibacillus alkalisoli]|uniref:Uncharacterized protein n=1 Tax=Lysinibacillus alkalisoli TaxID=1911548 RepID=A0A917D5J6_9BACI|nr:hypothetical protein [Lysinibacillus alkalisoli]GGG10473.1 hypothetical protein GCM10007425_01010 [Lysinibacillus alkalisoli]